VPDVELILEVPAADSSELDLPDPQVLPRTEPVSHASGLDGAHVLQASIVVTAGTVRVLRTWLLARTERLQNTRVVWNGREFHGYTAQEVELLLRALERELGDEPPAQ
jgi:hypothetical protein